MKHPIWIALGLGLAVLVAAFVPPAWRMLNGGGVPLPGPDAGAAGADPAQLPWAVRAVGEGRSRVFGLTLGQATLADAEARFGDGMLVAVVARIDEIGALEALVDPLAAGFVSGRLVLTLDVPADTLRRWRGRSSGSQPMAGGVRRFELAPPDRAEARAMRIAGLSFVPALRLSGQDVRERFGPPAERRALPDQGEALLYPALGLVAVVQPDTRALLQYVAPAAFDQRLRDLLAGPGAPGQLPAAPGAASAPG